MLTENQLRTLPDALQGHFMQLEQDVIGIICKHIGEINKLSATDVHRLNELQRIGFNMQEIQREIAKSLDRAEADIYAIFSKSSQNEYGDSRTLYDLTGRKWIPFEQNDRLKQLIEDISQSTLGSFRNIADSRALGMVNARGNVLPLADFYQQTVDYAIIQVKTGQENIYSGMHSAVMKMADEGLSSVAWESGYRQRLDTAVRRNILGGMADLSMKQAEAVGQQIGADGMEISWHSGYRPTHDFGGQQFTIQEFIQHIKPLMEEANCYHRAFPIVLGVSAPAYSRKELDSLERKQTEVHTFEGREYNQYEAEQRQRKYEVAIRQQKDRENAFSASGDEESAKTARTRARVLNNNYRKFSEAMQLNPHPKRTRVPRPKK